MDREERWNTSVHDLMLNFRDALTALTPFMDKAKIGWRDVEAYDDWDEISQCLYQDMVVRSIQFSVKHQHDWITPDYGTVYPSYGDKSFIDVSERNLKLGGYQVFIGFSTLEHPFDQIRYQAVFGDDLRAVGEPTCMPLGEAKFMFVVNKESGGREKLSAILVDV
jgi:hypothetical protein